MSTKTTGKKKKLGSYPFFTVVFSIFLSLVLTGGIIIMIALGSEHVNRIESIELHVYLNRNISKSDQKKTSKLLNTKPYIKKENGKPKLTYFSEEDMAENYVSAHNNALTKDMIIETAGFNPFRACFAITIEEQFSAVNHLNEIKEEIEKIDGVYEVDLSQKKQSIIQTLHNNIQTLQLVLLIIFTLSLLVIIILINNTIKLALFSQRFLIRSMQLVGATASFIQMPFIKRSAIHGLVGGFIAAGALFVLLQYGLNQIKDLAPLYDSKNILLLLGSLPLLGGLLGLFSTYLAVNRYLKMSLDELY